MKKSFWFIYKFIFAFIELILYRIYNGFITVMHWLCHFNFIVLKFAINCNVKKHKLKNFFRVNILIIWLNYNKIVINDRQRLRSHLINEIINDWILLIY